VLDASLPHMAWSTVLLACLLPARPTADAPATAPHSPHYT
jgi:hypothetical protein